MPDFTLYNHGSICILTPMTTKGRSWIKTYVVDDVSVQKWGRNGVVIEPRFVGSILDCIKEDGLTVSL